MDKKARKVLIWIMFPWLALFEIKKIRKVLIWLFPEYQIIESIEEYGFIAKVSVNTAVSGGNVVSQAASQNVTKSAATSPARFQNKATSNAAVRSGKAEVSVRGESLESKIAGMKANVKAAIVGQETAIENLIVALKRPLVIGTQRDAPRNTFFITGGKSSGRHTILTAAVTAAKRECLINYYNISKLNLALYPTTSEKSLFLSDLYRVLCENSDVILFENFENCHDDALQVIISLVAQGKYTLSERYAEQGGNLVQATGALMQTAVSEITANGKYFAFITQASENKIADKLGAKFMDKVADIIVMDDYSGNDILRITNKILSELRGKAKAKLTIRLAFSTAFIEHCVRKYKQKEGLSLISEFVTGYVYKALSEYKLRNGNTLAGFTLDYDSSGGITLIPDIQGAGDAVSLTRYLPKRKTSNIDEVKAELADIIGLAKVKEFVLNLENNLNIQKMREDAGHKAASISRHMIFTGNPGTGKTTIARIVAKYFRAIGLLSVGQLREVSRSDLVGQYIGHTAKQTNEVIQSALGGVLFIDEAYSLCRDKNDIFGLEAVDALVKAVEDYRDELVVILAGYQDEMREFLKNNPGLKSRFPNAIDFEDYTASEMVQIAHITAKFKGYKIDGECIEGLTRLLEKSQVKGRNDGGNGRLVRNVIEAAILAQSKRITKDTPKDRLDILLAIDFNFEDFDKFDIDKRLSEIIGLNSVKDFVRTQYRLLIADEKRRKAGVSVDSTQSLNMIFTGNPGTGKTTVARVVASMFKEMGMLKRGHLVETDRGGLVSEYVGQTAKKTE
ncbi:MAG: AAA family ATPase, partial [Holophagales bacterium]|nr:AAA family ATPase [Holophagales bacterium]